MRAHAGRARRPHRPWAIGGEGGFTLVEVMVATAVFVIASIAVLTLVVNSVRTIGANADRVYAASLVRSEIERLQGIGASAIGPGTVTSTVVDPNGQRTFTLTRTADWVALGQGTTLCRQSGAVNAAYLRVQVSAMGGKLKSPQSANTLIYTYNSEDPNTGVLKVTVKDSVGAPISGATVTGLDQARLGSSLNAVTDASGCVTMVDAIAGVWDVTVTVPGGVYPAGIWTTNTATQSGSIAGHNPGATPNVLELTFTFSKRAP